MTRWIKVWRDTATMPGRLVTIVTAMTVSIAGVVAMLSTYLVLTREVPRNYVGTRPASMQLVVPAGVTDDMLTRVRQVPAVAQASPARRVRGRLRTPSGDWVPMLLFVVPHTAGDSINMVEPEAGAWPAGPGALLVERSALTLTQQPIGASVTIEIGRGVRRSIRIAGTVHDPGVAPAWQEQTIYGYIDQATLAALGDDAPMTQLKVLVRDPRNVPGIEATADTIVRLLGGVGARVTEVHIPPPGRHPHQSQMNAVMLMLLQFSLLALALGAVLTATIISGLLAQQVRQIAMMKAVGADTAQIAGLYLVPVAALGGVAVAIGLPLGLFAGRGLIGVVAELLNLSIASLAMPWWLYPAALLLGVGAPVLAAVVPVVAAARRTVRSALDDSGAGAALPTGTRTTRWLTRVQLPSPALTLAFRNTIRRRRRAAFTAALLAAAGAMLITSLNLRAAWEGSVATSAADRRYALEVHLAGSNPTDSVLRRVRAIDGVTAVEPWDGASSTVDDGRTFELSHSYPDGAHGGFSLRAAPPDTRLIAHVMREGRWLTATDSNGVVLNTMAVRVAFPGRHPGDRVAIRTGDAVDTLVVVGITRELLTPGNVYATPARFRRITGRGDVVSAIRVALRPDVRTDAMAPLLLRTLESSGTEVSSIITESRLGAAQGGHVYILIAALGAIAVIMTIVGLLGLSSSLGIAVVERTREFGVMRAIGAGSAPLLTMIVAEGALIAMLSWLLALPAAVVLSRIVGGVLARIAAQDLDLRLSPAAAGLWLLIVVCSAVVISLWPAVRASRLTVRESLSFT